MFIYGETLLYLMNRERKRTLNFYMFLLLTFALASAFQYAIDTFVGHVGNVIFALALVFAYVKGRESFFIYIPVQFLYLLHQILPIDAAVTSLTFGIMGLLLQGVFRSVWRVDLSFSRFKEWLKYSTQATFILLSLEITSFFLLQEFMIQNIETHIFLSMLIDLSNVVLVSPMLITFVQTTRNFTLWDFTQFVIASIRPYNNDGYLLFTAIFVVPVLQFTALLQLTLNPLIDYYWLTLPLLMFVAYKFDKRFVSIYSSFDAAFVTTTILIAHQSNSIEIRETLEVFSYLLIISIVMVAISILASNERALQMDKYEIQSILLKSRANQMMGELTGGIAHDFNNTLQAIYGSAELLKLEYSDEIVDSILSRVENGLQLTSELLRLTRRHPGEVTTFNIDKMIASFTLIQNRILRRRWMIVPDLNSGANVRMNSKQLSNILLNLVKNAQEAMADGGQIHIRTRVERVRKNTLNGKYVVIEIEDSGVGIPQKNLQDIFVPFYTTKKEGSGLGLASVKSLLGAVGGASEVTSTVSVGTTFTLYIPVSEEQVSTSSVYTENDWPDIDGKIIIIDDDDEIRETLSTYLRSRGYVVESYHSPEEVLEHQDLSQAGLLITDVIMEGISGTELVMRLRDRGIEVPTILISGYQNIESSEFPSGRNISFLQKPFTFNNLKQVMVLVLEK